MCAQNSCLHTLDPHHACAQQVLQVGARQQRSARASPCRHLRHHALMASTTSTNAYSVACFISPTRKPSPHHSQHNCGPINIQPASLDSMLSPALAVHGFSKARHVQHQAVAHLVMPPNQQQQPVRKLTIQCQFTTPHPRRQVHRRTGGVLRSCCLRCHPPPLLLHRCHHLLPPAVSGAAHQIQARAQEQEQE